MSFGVEDIFIKRHHIVVNKYKIEILECFSKEERLLHVVFARIVIVDIDNTGIAAVGSAMFFNCLCRTPGPFAVLVVPGHAPQIKIGFNYFRSQDIIFLIAVHSHGLIV